MEPEQFRQTGAPITFGFVRRPSSTSTWRTLSHKISATRPARDRVAIRFEQFQKGGIVSIAPRGVSKKDADRCDKHGTQPGSVAPRRSTASATIGAARVEQPQSPQVTA